ncbi:MAG: polysaccharide export protein [Syntrophales bacterium]|nr:polysaccharide export protein [Syntrophales bacterium]MDY0044946.1 polysaccharide biosynthesis/export family protein [Syntrophales bacterium]
MKFTACICTFLALVSLFISGCAPTPAVTERKAAIARTEVDIKPAYKEKFTSTVAETKIPEISVHEYLIGAKDILSVIVYGEEDLSLKESTVTADGFISMPLVGRISVAGLTTLQIEKKITKLLSDGYLINPQVTVVVKSFQSKKAFILGAVEKPGSYPLQGNAVLLELISTAGGILYESAGKYILIWRAASGEKTSEDEESGRVIRIATERLLKEGDMRLNVPIEDRDVVFVPQAEQVYIIGEVKNPGSFPIIKDKITVLEAITMAGGFTRIASPNKTRIIRVEDGIEKTIYVRANDIIKGGEKSKDIPLQSGDIVVVPESLF